MKRRTVLWAIIIFYTGFALASCSEGFFGKTEDLQKEAEDADVLAGTVSITSASNWCGGTLDAVVQTPGFSGEITYEWRIEDADEPVGSGSQYTIKPEDIGRNIDIRIARADATGSITSSAFQISLYHPIFNEDDLRAVQDNLGYHYILVNDIDLQGEWVPITPYNGVFEGNGKTISNLRINGIDRQGLFGNIRNDGIVQNIILSNVNIDCHGSYIGALAGHNSGIVKNCSVQGTVRGGFSVGGLAGANNGIITGSTAIIHVYGIDGSGGLAGDNTHTIIQCYVKGSVTSSNNEAGGVAGGNFNQIIGCFSDCDVSCQKFAAGGIAGFNSGPIKDCYATGDILCLLEEAGGIAGYNRDSINRCYFTGTVTSGSDYAGGIAGYSDESVENCVALGKKITGGEYTGRIIGYNDEGYVANNYANENMLINGTQDYSDDSDSIHGLDVSSGEYGKQGFWSDLGYDFSSAGMWVWDSILNLPVLMMANEW